MFNNKFIILFIFYTLLMIMNQKIQRKGEYLDISSFKQEQETVKQLFRQQKQASLPFSDVQNNKTTNIPHTCCKRCKVNMYIFECPSCGSKLCKLCDEDIHSKGKFILHQRSELEIVDYAEQDNKINIRISEIKEDDDMKNIQNMITTMNVTQKWKKIINEIQQKFQELLLQLKQKKQDILMKLEKKKNIQIKSLIENLNQLRSSSLGGRKSSVSDEGTRKSLNSQKLENLQSKLKNQQCEHQDQSGKCQGRMQINNFFFEELKNMMEKIDSKNLITKTLCQSQQQYKKKMRSSMLNINSTSYLSPYSSGIRSPRNGKVNQSILIQEMRNVQQRLNQQENIVTKSSILNESKMLQKVKSEKILLKSKNIDCTIRQKKPKKFLGIMI